MPIQIKAPDGSIAQFPDGMADADIEKVMAQHYPQPSALDRIAASPIGRFAHDAVIAPIQNILSGPASFGANLANAIPGNETTIAGNTLPKMAPVSSTDALGTEDLYQGALGRNRNTPGYAAARSEAQKYQAVRGSGFADQMIAPMLPALAGATGLPGGFDAMNANADAQTAAQDAYREKHPVLSFGAGLIGGGLIAPELKAPSAAPFSAMSGAPIDAASAYVRRLGADPVALRAAQANATGKPITAAEAIGKPGEVALGALARREGATPDALSGLVRSRNSAAPQRILGDYAQASGIDPNAARGDIEAFIEANQKAASPLYEQAYKANTNIASPMLDRILETPAGKKALADARVKMQNDMSLMGTPDADLMSQAAEGGTALPPKGAASGMKLRVYDYIKRSLNDQVSAAYRAGNSDEGNIIRDLNKSLVKAVDDADVTGITGPNSRNPNGGMYAQARAKAGEYLSAKKQFETGQDHILDNNFTAKDFAGYYGKLGPADQQAYMGGVANKLFNLQQSSKLRADIFKSPMIQSKLSTVMGSDKARTFIKNMETEQAMANFARQRVPGAGSPTAEYLQAMKDQDGASAMAMDAVQLGHDTIRQGLMPAIGNLALNKAKNAAATYVTRGMAIPVRDEAGRLLMLPPKDLAAHLQSLPQVFPQPPLQLPRLPQNGAIPYGLLAASPQLVPRSQ